MLPSRLSLALCFLLVWGGGAGARARDFEQMKRETFEAVWSEVDRSYYDATFGGKDWGAIGESYRARLDTATDAAGLRALLEAMLFELGASHFGIHSAQSDAGEAGPAVWEGDDWGGEIALWEAGALVYRLRPDGPALAAGLANGDRLVSIDGVSIESIFEQADRSAGPPHLRRLERLIQLQRRLSGAVGSRVELVALDPAGHEKRCSIERVRYEGSVTPPLGNMGAMPLAIETKRFPDGIGYLRFSVWFPVAMAEIRPFVTGLGEECPGLIIDLRGNPGGIGIMAGGLAGLLVDRDLPLGTTTLRAGRINFVGFPQRGGFLGPVAILIDAGSCSTSEIFALGMQEAGRARVFGQRSGGAAMPSFFVDLPNGDTLQTVMGDFRTARGRSPEGGGVDPDQLVALSPIELSQGIDTVIESARKWLLENQPSLRTQP